MSGSESLADTLFVGGRVFTAGMKDSRAGGLAVRDGQILAVGEDDDLQALVGTRTQVVDLHGGLLFPGFQDAHVHPVMAGVAMLQCELHGTRSAQECLDRIAAYAAANPALEWIVGSGWSMEFFPGGTPTRQMLDAVVPDRPAILTNRDGHGAWANTVALQRAGLDASTPDPRDGRIEREADGTPSGSLHEGAVKLVSRHAGDADGEQAYAGLLAAQEALFGLGVTSWQDAGIADGFGVKGVYDAYVDAAGRGDLLARVVGALWWERDGGAEQIAELRPASSRGQRRAVPPDHRQDHAGRYR